MNKLECGFYVSCQPAIGDEIFYDFEFIKRFALAAEHGGAKAVRIEGASNVKHLIQQIKIPIIALIKKQKENTLGKRNITPFYEDIINLYDVGAKIIAVDFTFREECDKEYYKHLMIKVKKELPDVKILADISTIEEAIMAEECEVNYISSTLVSYTEQTKQETIPNFDILREMKRYISIPFIAEGGFETSEQISEAIKHSIHGVVMGTAITRPHIMTSKFSKLWEEINEDN